MIERKFKFNKFGLTENPIGHYVAMPWKGGALLGEVIGVKVNETLGVLHLEVRHFCGDMWPISPTALSVMVIA